MPVLLYPKYQGRERRSGLNWQRMPPGTRHDPRSDVLHIGLVNNMADTAMGPTEQQFLTLLEEAAGDIVVQFSLYALPEVERKPTGQRRVGSFYFGTDELRELPPEQHPDGLIVTGREPRTLDLRDEVYWPGFQALLKWAREQACSTVWSCLAAHGAVLALDGIERVRSRNKHFGIFTCEQAAPHPLLAGAPTSLQVPHSRWNGISADQLTAKGYEVLTRTSDGGVDTFVKQDAGLFVFFQGHPEYESDMLMGEYRRDVGRFLRGERDSYPLLPLNYFDARIEQSLQAIEAKAHVCREAELLDDVSGVLSGIEIDNSWRRTAILLYRNWLEHLRQKKRDTAKRDVSWSW